MSKEKQTHFAEGKNGETIEAIKGMVVPSTFYLQWEYE